MGSFGRSFSALMRKNFILRKRKWISSIFEFILPSVFLLILVLVKLSQQDNEDFSPQTVEPSFPSNTQALIPFSFSDYVTALRAQRLCTTDTDPRTGDDFWITGIPYKGRNWPVPFVKCDSRKCTRDGQNATDFCEFPILAVAPQDGAQQDDIMVNFTEYVTQVRYPELGVPGNLPFLYDFVQTFSSNDAIEDYVRSDDYGTSGKPKIGVAVILNLDTSGGGRSYEYSIRVNSTNYNAPEEEGRPASPTTPNTDRLFDNFAKNDFDVCVPQGGTPDQGPYQNSCTGQYIYNGALAIQRLVDDWIMYHSGARAAGSFVAENGVVFVPFPTREYVENGFYSNIAAFAPLLAVLGLLYPVAAMIRSIVQEKELRQKELMKMMSVTEAAIGWSWFASLFIFYTLSALLCAGVTYALYENSSFVFLFIFWEVAFISFIVFAFLVSSWFSKSIRATLVGILLFFVGYFLIIPVDYSDSSMGLIRLVSLHPVTALSFGMQVIGELEDDGVGIVRSSYDISDNPSGYAFNDAIASLIICSILWGFVSWYLNRVIPGDFGQPFPWYFPFTKSYWCPGSVHPQYDDADRAAGSELSGEIPIEPVSATLKEQEKEGKCVVVRNLRKQYGVKTAVDGLNLSMYSGQVTALLGHNGAGKTTTINMLTGMVAPTSGYALVAGKDIRVHMSQIREGVGICLQHDCLFPLLTVKEHLRFYARIKGMYQTRSRDEVERAITSAIDDVALLEKQNNLSKDLSGGMKRKLSVAIAFCGDPKVVFLDEPTSGMDPFSRRFTWNVIRQYRQDRCIILTTHFMDEADLLGDRIAIMSAGQLRCSGSSLFLKKSFGVGYQLTIEKRANGKKALALIEETDEDIADVSNTSVTHAEDGTETELAEIKSEPKNDNVKIERTLERIVKGAVSEATVLSDVGTEISFQLPIGSSDKFIGMFEDLDNEVKRGAIVTYGVSITTLDEVFMMVARGEMGEKKATEFASLRSSGILESQLVAERSHRSKMDLEKEGLFFRHVSALFAKRAINFKRDKKAWFCSTVFPSIMTLIGFVLVTVLPADRNYDSLTLSLSDYNVDVANKERQNPIPFNTAPGNYSCQPGKCFYANSTFRLSQTGENYTYCGESASLLDDNCASDYCGPYCSVADSDEFLNKIAGGVSGVYPYGNSNVGNVNESSYAISTSSTDQFEASQYGALFFSHDVTSAISTEENTTLYGDAAYQTCVANSNELNYQDESDCENFRGIGYIVQYNFTSLHAALLYQAVADEAIVKDAVGDDITISATIHPLPITKIEQNYVEAEDSFAAWFLLVLSFPFISGAFGSFVVSERMSKAKHLQTVAGVKPEAYWLSSYLWDVLNYQLPCWIVIILMFAFDLDTFTRSSQGVVGGVITLFILFGPAAAGFTYCVSFGFKNPSMCTLFVIVFNFLAGMAAPMVCFILRLIGESAEDRDEGLIAIAAAIEWILRFVPSFCFGKGLFYTINIETLEFFEGEPITVWNSSVMLYEVIFLGLESIFYLLLAIQIDKWSTNPGAVRKFTALKKCLTCRCFCRKGRDDDRGNDAGAEVPDDEDVIAEGERVLSGGANDDLIVLNQLTKIYPNGKLAVNHLSLGIPPGECFGLLGINGAGKTTTMGMLTAEFPPTSGDATLAGFSITHQPEQTRRRIGYCPQFDAHFMNMTGREHVELYASIKGVPKDSVKEAAAFKLKEVGLSEKDGDRLSAQYSGGMKRKLSVACATIGQPQIVFLDEPSTGMDPVARRDLWQVISSMVIGDGTEDYEDKTSVILTTHSMEECEALCPRIGIMAAGKLRCLGSAQHLKTRFGKGYQVEMKVRDVDNDDEDFRTTLLKLLGHVGGESAQADVEAAPHTAEDVFVKLDQVISSLSALTGDDYLSSMIDTANPSGYVIYKSATTGVGIALDELAVFCVEELRIRALIEFFEQRYSNCILRERQDNKVRFEVGSEGLKVSTLFASIEENKESLMLSDYGVSQTSLEQVFNMHAAMHANWHSPHS